MEEKSVHPGQLPFIMANLRNGVLKICRSSEVHPAITAMILREAANQFDAQAQGLLDSFLRQVKQDEETEKARKTVQVPTEGKEGD